MKQDKSHPVGQLDESGIVKRPMWCPRCAARARVVANPFYGVGLAVHRHLLGCTRCDFVAFLTTPREDEEVVRNETVQAVHRHWFGGRFARLLWSGR